MKLHLGKGEARPDPRDFKFRHYDHALKTFQLPANFGFDHAIPPKAWGMLGNDEQGDCVWAGACHEHMLFGARGSGAESFTTTDALADYHACAGPEDNGTDVHEAMAYRQRTGIMDALGVRHKIGAYVSIDHTNLTQVWQALYSCEAVGLGIQFPDSAMDQFNAGKKWSVVPGAQIEGGHYVPLVSRSTKMCKVVTWGQLQTVDQGFLSAYLDEAWAFVSVDTLNGAGRTRRGLDIDALNADLQAL